MYDKKATILKLIWGLAVLIILSFIAYNSINIKSLEVKTYNELKEYMLQGKSFDFTYDVTKEPDEKIRDGVLIYNDFISNLTLNDNGSISSISKKLATNASGDYAIVKRTFYPDGTVSVGIKIVDKDNKTKEQFVRKGVVGKSVFLSMLVNTPR
jgi:hypothetical protein